ncbi:MAG: radical SAM family heme chaperone HemW [Synergistaceae bacterium]|nr:radical SAM family heme chaperone HemW [Synergistaceae bacterium]
MNIAHLYIHIPFCVKKCNYCSFASHVPQSGEIEFYLKHLQKELLLVKQKHNLLLDTLYIGGGTPTVISPLLWQDFSDFLFKNLKFNSNAEITVEANPGTLRAEHIHIFRDAGVTRISIGVQSFDDSELQMMGRCHTARQAHEAISACLASGFRTSGDIIYSLPHQNFYSYARSLKELVTSGVGHVSLYQLSLEHGTPWQNLPKDSMTDGYEEYRYAIWYLKKKGIYQYEISNFAKPHEESRHNMAYWTGKDYIGLGVSAASFIMGQRFQNTNNVKLYAKMINDMKLPVAAGEILSRAKSAREAAVLLLRTTNGIDKKNFISKFGSKMLNEISNKLMLLPSGLVAQNDSKIYMTQKGMRVANLIWQEII